MNLLNITFLKNKRRFLKVFKSALCRKEKADILYKEYIVPRNEYEEKTDEKQKKKSDSKREKNHAEEPENWNRNFNCGLTFTDYPESYQSFADEKIHRSGRR